MNRQLKFRVYDTLDKRYIKCDEGYQGHYVLSLKGEYHNLLNGSGGKECIVQQWTGLVDKNGVDIYEGDVVTYTSNNGKDYKAPVVFSPTSAAFVLDTSGRHLFDDKYGDYLDFHKDREYEVIGNIFAG